MNLEFWDLFVIAVVSIAVIATVIGGIGKKRRVRKRLENSPMPTAWEEIIRSNVALYRRMPEKLRCELRGRVNVFIHEKDFEGCGGLEITDEIRVTIAALASILLLNKDIDYYPWLKSVIVYPTAYVTGNKHAVGTRIFSETTDVRLGESWVRGAVVLAWDHVRHDARQPGSGHNVCLHEFAHQLDQENGVSDGIPVFSGGDDYERFRSVLSREYELLRHGSEMGLHDIIDEYGGINPAEFFAVATESFFELPELFRRFHPELYDVLRNYYRLDPAGWNE